MPDMKKKINDKKICFIICSNNKMLMDECALYLNRLFIPNGYSVEICVITDARSMTEGYNRAMDASDAKYKIYLHQDVFIINRWILFNILELFEQDNNIGMIGLVGTDHISDSGIMWAGHYIGVMYNDLVTSWSEDHSDMPRGYVNVEAVDGFFIATDKDVRWREDLFDGFDFYDVSQSCEFRKKGYKVIVPFQNDPWCVHDDGQILNFEKYNHYRKIFINNYLD